MKVGLIARSEDRGLGNLTWEWAEHMQPERVLLVVPQTQVRHAVAQRPERYAHHDLTVVQWEHGVDLDPAAEAQVRRWLDGLDVVYSAETFYDWRICEWARDMKVRTVCHVMPEFYRHGHLDAPPGPDTWWAPTRWRLEHLDPATRLVPVPIATERFRRPRRPPERPPRWLHIAGTRAAGDRNGTRLFLTAMRYLRERHDVYVRAQGPTLTPPRTARHTNVTMVRGHAGEYWQLYDDVDALVLPRRYAGLSLPALEAMGAGLAVAMTDAEPQRSEWPIIPLDPAPSARGSIRTAAGEIPLVGVDPRAIAATMDDFARKPSLLVQARGAAQRFAQANSWEQLEPTVRAELERACR